jgi:hypothetical protein
MLGGVKVGFGSSQSPSIIEVIIDKVELPTGTMVRNFNSDISSDSSNSASNSDSSNSCYCLKVGSPTETR